MKPGTKVYSQPRENRVSAGELTGPKAAYIMVMSMGKQSVNRSAMDLFRGVFTMVDGSDWERRGAVALGSRYEADFTTSYQASQNIADFERDNPEFVAKVKAALKYAQTGE